MKKIYSLKHFIFLFLFLVFCGGVSAQISNVHVEYSCPCRVTVTYDLSVGLCDRVLLYYSPDTVSVGWLFAKTLSGKSVGTNTEIWDCEAAGEIFGLYYYKLAVAPDFVTINGVRWATRNVDMPNTFCECPTDTGMYYKWNRKVGWSNKNPLINSDGGTTWDDTYDRNITVWQSVSNPCPSGFRVPTTAEINALINTTYVTYQSTIDNNNPYKAGGGRFTDTGADGRGNAGNSIFMPTSTCRANNGYIYGMSMLGVIADAGYWGNSQSNGPAAVYAFFFDLSSAFLANCSKSAALPVRCVVQ